MVKDCKTLIMIVFVMVLFFVLFLIIIQGSVVNGMYINNEGQEGFKADFEVNYDTLQEFDRYRSDGCYNVNGNHHYPLKANFRNDANPIEKCALLAKGRGYKNFGLTQNGMCVTGPNRRSILRDGKTTKCVNALGTKKGIHMYRWDKDGPNVNVKTMINIADDTGKTLKKEVVCIPKHIYDKKYDGRATDFGRAYSDRKHPDVRFARSDRKGVDGEYEDELIVPIPIPEEARRIPIMDEPVVKPRATEETITPIPGTAATAPTGRGRVGKTRKPKRKIRTTAEAIPMEEETVGERIYDEQEIDMYRPYDETGEEEWGTYLDEEQEIYRLQEEMLQSEEEVVRLGEEERIRPIRSEEERLGEESMRFGEEERLGEEIRRSDEEIWRLDEETWRSDEEMPEEEIYRPTINGPEEEWRRTMEEILRPEEEILRPEEEEVIRTEEHTGLPGGEAHMERPFAEEGKVLKWRRIPTGDIRFSYVDATHDRLYGIGKGRGRSRKGKMKSKLYRCDKPCKGGWIRDRVRRGNKPRMLTANEADNFYIVKENGRLVQRDPQNRSERWIHDPSRERRRIPGRVIKTDEKRLLDIAVPKDDMWVLGKDGKVYRANRKGRRLELTPIKGRFKEIETDGKNLYAIKRNGKLFKKPSKGSGDWKKIGDNFEYVSATGKTHLWGIDSDRNLQICEKPCEGVWTPIDSNKFRNISATDDDIYGVDGRGRVWKSTFDQEEEGQEPYVKVFGKCDFGAWSKKIRAGSYNRRMLEGLGIKNNSISSIKLGPNTEATFYGNGHFRGRSFVLRNNSDHEIVGNRCLNNSWNNRISSIIVAPLVGPIVEEVEEEKSSKGFAVFYGKCDFKGWRKRLQEGHYDRRRLWDLDIPNNRISSIVLGPKTVVEIYDKNNFRGKKLRLVNPSNTNNDNNKCLPQRWNNKISSLKIFDYDSYMIKEKPYAVLSNKCGFSGIQNKVSEGDYNMSQLVSMNVKERDIKAVRAGPKTVVELYELDNFRGKVVRVVNEDEKKEKEMECLKDYKFGFLFSSIKIISHDKYKKDLNDNIPKAIFFQQCGLAGNATKLLEGYYTTKDMRNQGMQMDLSALKVAPRTTVILYDRDKFKGNSWKITNEAFTETIQKNCFRDQSRNGNRNWNNRVKSIKVLQFGDDVEEETPIPTPVEAIPVNVEEEN